MSINVTVNGNPVNIRRGKVLLVDNENLLKKEFDKRRILRLEQVRQQSKDVARRVRRRAEGERDRYLGQLEQEQCDRQRRRKEQELASLQRKYERCLQEIGSGHLVAASEPDAEDVLEAQRRSAGQQAVERGRAALELLERRRRLEKERGELVAGRRRCVHDAEELRATLVRRLSPTDTTRKEKKQSLAEVSLNVQPQTGSRDGQCITSRLDPATCTCSTARLCQCLGEFSGLPTARSASQPLSLGDPAPRSLPSAMDEASRGRSTFALDSAASLVPPRGDSSLHRQPPSLGEATGRPSPQPEPMSPVRNTAPADPLVDVPACSSRSKVQVSSGGPPGTSAGTATERQAAVECGDVGSIGARRAAEHKVQFYDYISRFEKDADAFYTVHKHHSDEEGAGAGSAVRAAALEELQQERASSSRLNLELELERRQQERCRVALERERLRADHQHLLRRLPALALARAQHSCTLMQAVHQEEGRARQRDCLRQDNMASVFERLHHDLLLQHQEEATAPSAANNATSPAAGAASPQEIDEDTPAKLNVGAHGSVAPEVEPGEEGPLAAALERLRACLDQQHALVSTEAGMEAGAPTAHLARGATILQETHRGSKVCKRGRARNTTSIRDRSGEDDGMRGVAEPPISKKDEVQESTPEKKQRDGKSRERKDTGQRANRAEARSQERVREGAVNEEKREDRDAEGKRRSRYKARKKFKMKDSKGEAPESEPSSNEGSEVVVVSEYSVDMSTSKRSEVTQSSFNSGEGSSSGSLHVSEDVKVSLVLKEVTRSPGGESDGRPRRRSHMRGREPRMVEEATQTSVCAGVQEPPDINRTDGTTLESSGSTAYLSPPLHLAAERADAVEQLLHCMKRQEQEHGRETNPVLLLYIARLLSMSRASVEDLASASNPTLQPPCHCTHCLECLQHAQHINTPPELPLIPAATFPGRPPEPPIIPAATCPSRPPEPSRASAATCPSRPPEPSRSSAATCPSKPPERASAATCPSKPPEPSRASAVTCPSRPLEPSRASAATTCIPERQPAPTCPATSPEPSIVPASTHPGTSPEQATVTAATCLQSCWSQPSCPAVTTTSSLQDVPHSEVCAPPIRRLPQTNVTSSVPGPRVCSLPADWLVDSYESLETWSSGGADKSYNRWDRSASLFEASLETESASQYVGSFSGSDNGGALGYVEFWDKYRTISRQYTERISSIAAQIQSLREARKQLESSSSGSDVTATPRPTDTSCPTSNSTADTSLTWRLSLSRQRNHQRPPSVLDRSGMTARVGACDVAHELSTIVEVDTPQSSQVIPATATDQPHDSDDSLPDVTAELVRRGLVTDPLQWQAMVHQGLEASLDGLGMGWAGSALRKARQAQQLSPSSSEAVPLHHSPPGDARGRSTPVTRASVCFPGESDVSTVRPSPEQSPKVQAPDLVLPAASLSGPEQAGRGFV